MGCGITDKYLSLIFELNDPLMIEDLLLRMLAFNNLNLLNLLVEKNFDFASFSKDGKNLLHHAVLFGSTNLIERLIELKVDCNALDFTGNKPFEIIPEVNQAKMRPLLEKHGYLVAPQRIVRHGLFPQPLNKDDIASVLSEDEFNAIIRNHHS